MPNYAEPITIIGKKDNSWIYVKYHKKHWEAIPKALGLLKRRWLVECNYEMFTAAEKGNLKKLLKFIKLGRFDPAKAVDEGHNMCLHKASYRGHTKIVEVLLEQYKCPVNVANSPEKGGLYPLHMASYNGHVEVMMLLIAHGAKLRVKDACGL